MDYCENDFFPYRYTLAKPIPVKYDPGKSVFCSMKKERIRRDRISEIIHCSFEGLSSCHTPSIQPEGPGSN